MIRLFGQILVLLGLSAAIVWWLPQDFTSRKCRLRSKRR
jgi:hypothetical protein